MYKGKALIEKLNIDFLLKIHYECILLVDENILSVDEGFSQAIELIYGMTNHISLTQSEKLHFLLEIAYISFAVEKDNNSYQQSRMALDQSFLISYNSPN